jgi:hypothetical protein
MLFWYVMPESATESTGSSEIMVLPTARQNSITSKEVIFNHHKNLEFEKT